MFQAIQTKFLGPTNTRGARVKATADAGSITVQWDHRLNIQDNHRAAAAAAAARAAYAAARAATWQAAADCLRRMCEA